MNPILYDFGIISIKWYSVLILLGMLLGGATVLREAKKWEINEDFVVNLFFYTIIFSLIGARLYYVAFNLDYYLAYPLSIIKVWEGGLAIHGGILFGLITVLVYCKKYKVKIPLMIDIIVPGLILGQAIGRWGNFFNGEAHGMATTYETLKGLFIPDFIIKGMNIDGVYYHPTFLYESLLCLLGFFIILFLRRRKNIKITNVTSFYLIWYGIVRAFIETMRTDSLMIGNFKVAIIVSILMIILGIVLLVLSFKKSKFENKYNDIENVENINF